MSPTSSRATGSPDSGAQAFGDEARAIAALAQRASVETTWRDIGRLKACQPHLARGALAYVSFIPGQTWRETISACVAVRAAGFEPVPHIPARELASAEALDNLMAQLAARVGVRRVLLVGGDRGVPAGPFAQSLDVMRSGMLARNGIREVAVAAHPEGHPRIAEAELRRAEEQKIAYAEQQGIELTFVTQFCFEAVPFLAWARELRARAVHVRIVAGLAGPASLATLFKYALRCGVGPSVRALGARPGTLAGLIGDRGPESVVRTIALSAAEPGIEPVGIHLYSFGGLARTCAWIDAVAHCRFELDEERGFIVAEP
ncbi:MAG TPA: methylenetetrahydrofolate reductase [Usitatibacter sp.]